MIDARIISITGPPGSGKTAFIERLLEATDGWVQVVRCYREPDLTEPREASARILRRVKRDFAREHRQEERRLMDATSAPEATLVYLESHVGPGMAEIARRNPDTMESFRSRIRSLAPHLRPADPKPGERAERWLLAEPWAGIERARPVVLSARGLGARGWGERALEDVVRLCNVAGRRPSGKRSFGSGVTPRFPRISSFTR